MVELALILGGAGVVMLLVGLVGGGFTFSGSVMPTVGKPMRVVCFAVGGLLTVAALSMAALDWAKDQLPSTLR